MKSPRRPSGRRSAAATIGAVCALGLTLSACTSHGAGSSSAAGAPSGSVSAQPGAAGKLHSELPAALQSKTTIDVAAVSDYPPLSYADAGDNSKIVGFNIDLLDQVASVLGVQFRYQDTSYDNLIPSLKSGRVVIAEGGASDTKDAIKATTLIDYLKVGAQMTVPTSNPAAITDFTSACGKRVATLAGTPEYLDDLNGASAKYCTATGKPAIKIQVFPTEDQGLLAVRSNRADAAYFSEVGNIYRIKQGLAFKAVGEVLEFAPISFQVPTSMPQLATAIKDALDVLIQNGTYHALVTKWGFPATSEVNAGAINSAAGTP